MKQFYFAAAAILLGATSCTPKPVAKDGSVKTTYMHKYGVEVDDATDWQERGSSGKVIKTLKNGQTTIESWQDGKLQGLTTITFPHSEIIQSEHFYDNGTLIWTTDHYRSGVPQKQKNFETGKCTVSTWYEDSSPQSIENHEGEFLVTGSYFTPQQEIESQIVHGEGLRIVRDGYGQLQQKELFTDGKLKERTTYHANSMPKSVVPYVEGIISGTKRTFLPNGEPATVEEWANNLPNGLTLVFENGEKTAEIPYVDGVKQGIEKRYRPGTAVVVEEISWQEDKRHGPYIAYVDSKKLTEWYFEGNKVSRSEFFEQSN